MLLLVGDQYFERTTIFRCPTEAAFLYTKTGLDTCFLDW
jgi:hypothetical protein